MKFIHTGLPASSEKKADSFFVDILGLEKSAPKTLNKNLSQALFGINNELPVINYKDENIHFEIIIYPDYKIPDKQIAHFCIHVNDLKNFISKCKNAHLEVTEVQKETGSVVTFVSDYDGNLFELKG